MFYSHQLLARKAPLGQIWMAATMHAKMNRKKLNKLNIIRICEEILNPSVPMALRLSGILMGGVVIVYERKVKLLYDDVTRLLVEINTAWKVKAVPDRSLLPKAKTRAKNEGVTLPENGEDYLGEIEQSLQYSNATMMGFEQTAYFGLRLDNLDDPYNSQNQPEDLPQDYHQADAANITLFDHFDSHQADTSMYNRFERFDIEGDEETQLNFTAPENTTIPSTLVPSPPPEEKPKTSHEILKQHPEDKVNQQSDEGQKAFQCQQDQFRQSPRRRRARRHAAFALDYEQTIIPGHIYQSWLQNASDIISRRRRKRKLLDARSGIKISNLMELPPVVLYEGLFSNGNREVHFPAPLLELWMRSTQPPHDSPSGRTSVPQPPEPSSSSPTGRLDDQDPLGYPFEDFHRVGSQSLGVSLEKLRANFNNNDMSREILMEGLRTNITNMEVPLPEANGFSFNYSNLMETPRNSSDEVRSIPSSGSGNLFLSHNSEVNSGRSNKKRPYSSTGHSSSGLEPVEEEYPWHHPGLNFKLAKLSENGLMPENELLVETGPTQTQKHPISSQPVDQITHSIRMQLKTHFDTPGSPKVESLNQLAEGMNKKRAACLFYQTCVLATRDFVRVQQKQPYGDILISRGGKM